ncbi:hypothetical protein GO684_02905 [Wolbachia endosymbiont of Litomosoides brasiliensis]|uniref:hypothetical protein n=1 Tax=Wolbachia endosymbiont of Litomosoides brasiliensis TaxID=1812117 RepID=UPI00158C6820|nr:hypothetical protein [Wolbachia endosymbiont of Litomosoides brasiliensis]NUY39616.1 hypothetical protein [Wolbachia endosymbiont of Litomosoides brasiliensis]
MFKSAICNDYRTSNLTLKEVAYLTGLFTGSATVGSVAPTVKVDSLSSLSTTMNSLIAIGFAAPVLLIVAAIRIAITSNRKSRNSEIIRERA